jgi:hypothetical protein
LPPGWKRGVEKRGVEKRAVGKRDGLLRSVRPGYTPGMSNTVTVQRVGHDRELLRDFIQLPYTIYAGVEQWVPWFRSDMRAIVRKKHPFFGHADGDFFVAKRAGETVGRVCAVENARYNEAHGTSTAHFYFPDFIDDDAVVNALFRRVAEWAEARGLTHVTGPMLFGGAAGSGVLIEGFARRAAMTMMRYNHPYYPRQLERLGFEKFEDLLSFSLDPTTFRVPEKVESLAERVLKRGRFKVLRFKNKRELKKRAWDVANMYNITLGDHPEDYPFTHDELKQLIKDLLVVADPKLEKIVTYDDSVVGYLLAFPDVSAALQRAKGRLTPWSLFDLFREFRKTRDLIINGMGVLPEYQRLGANALMYYELARTVQGDGRMVTAECTQVAESTDLMIRDLKTLGAEPYKIHRMYTRKLPFDYSVADPASSEASPASSEASPPEDASSGKG